MTSYSPTILFSFKIFFLHAWRGEMAIIYKLLEERDLDNS